jgi:surface-anchored protein
MAFRYGTDVTSALSNGVLLLALILNLACETRHPPGQEVRNDGGASSHGGDGISGEGGSDSHGLGGQAGEPQEPCDSALAGGSDSECAADGGTSEEGELGGASGAGGGEGCDFTYSEGHGDLYVRFDGALGLAIRSSFGSEPSEILADPSRVCVVVPGASYALAEAMGGAPDSPDYAFLGVDAGQPFWLLPATPRTGMPWFGASTEEVPLGRYMDDEVRLVIVATELPEGGQLAAWSTSTFGVPTTIFSTSSKALNHPFARGAHLHFNWAFSVAGTYTVTFRVEGRDEDGLQQSLASPLRFLVRP